MGDQSGNLFEIATVEVRGIPTKVFVHAPPSLRRVWELSAAHGDADYLVYEGERTDETLAAFTDGWFHTGDLGMLDDDGDLWIVDRLTDVVIRGGENVYAAELEAVLYEHPDVSEAAIIGVPHEDDVRAHVADRLAAFKVPTHVWLTTEELPRNASGKVLKRQLRDELTAAG